MAVCSSMCGVSEELICESDGSDKRFRRLAEHSVRVQRRCVSGHFGCREFN